jgi:formate dehydrogenase subunit gamma
VQPGNNAPMWRGCNRRASTGYSSLPKSEAPEAGNLIQPRAVPRLALHHAGEAWRQVRNDWIIPYGGSLLLDRAAGAGDLLLHQGPIGHHGGHRPQDRALHALRARRALVQRHRVRHRWPSPAS